MKAKRVRGLVSPGSNYIFLKIILNYSGGLHAAVRTGVFSVKVEPLPFLPC